MDVAGGCGCRGWANCGCVICGFLRFRAVTGVVNVEDEVVPCWWPGVDCAFGRGVGPFVAVGGGWAGGGGR